MHIYRNLALLMAIGCCPAVAQEPSMRHLYELDIAATMIEYLPASNNNGGFTYVVKYTNHPLVAAQYWHRLGKETLENLKAGEYQHWIDRDRILLQLEKVATESKWFLQRILTEEEAKKLRKRRSNVESELTWQLKKLAKAEEIVEILGADIAEELILQRTVDGLAFLYKRREIPIPRLSKIVLSSIGKTSLSLTPGQRVRIQSLIDRAAEKYLLSTETERGTLKIETDKDWKRVLDLANLKERNRLTNTFGGPHLGYVKFEWPIWYEHRKGRTKYVRHSGDRPTGIDKSSFYGTDVPNRPLGETDVWPDKLTEQQLQKHGFFKWDRLLFDLLQSKDIRADLDFTTAQLQAWEKVADTIQRKSILTKLWVNDDRIENLSSGTETLYPNQLRDLLNTQQLHDLRSLEYQVRVFLKKKSVQPSDLASPLLSTDTSKEKARLRLDRFENLSDWLGKHESWLQGDIERGLEKNLQDEVFPFFAQRFLLQNELDEKIKAVLTHKQREKIKGLIELSEQIKKPK